MFNLFAPRGFISFAASGYLSLIAGGEPIMISQLDYESGTDRLRFWGGIAAGYPFLALFSERVRLIAEKARLTQDFPHAARRLRIAFRFESCFCAALFPPSAYRYICAGSYPASIIPFGRMKTENHKDVDRLFKLEAATKFASSGK